MKIAYQGVAGSYSESCAKNNYPGCETIACKTFDECFEMAKNDNSIRSQSIDHHGSPILGKDNDPLFLFHRITEISRINFMLMHL